MAYVFLLGLGFARLGSPAGGWAEAESSAFNLDGASIEHQIRTWDFVSAQGARLPAPEPPSREERFLPCPILSYEDEGSPGAQSHLFLLLDSGRTPQDEREVIRLPADSMEETFHWREAALQERSAIWFLLDPLDAVFGLDNIRLSSGEGGSEASLSMQLSKLIESLGMPLDRSIFLGLNIELLGFERYEGGSLAMIDARHGTARVSYLSTGFGLTIKF